MFDPWLRRCERKAPVDGAVVVSALLHVLLVALATQSTRRPAAVPGPLLYNRVYYMPPPNTRPAQDQSTEQLEYIELAVPGPDAGPGGLGAARDGAPARPTVAPIGDLGHDYATLKRANFLPGNDTVYTDVEVDTVVTRLVTSAAPRYPESLREHNVEGTVRAQYVVDTTGFADTASFRVISASDTGFVTAVRAALPHMRFSPAKIRDTPVRQLVQQDFTFHLTRPADSSRVGSRAS